MFRLLNNYRMKFFRWFKRKFTPSVAPTADDPNFNPEFGIIIPHTKHAQGARSFDDKYSEYVYGCLLVDLLKVFATTRNNGGVAGASQTLKSKGCNSSLEVHLNGYDGTAEGCEILVLEGDKLSERFAREIIKDFRKAYPDRKIRGDGGIKWVGTSGRGAANLRAAKKNGMKVALLTEMFFIDNPDDFISVKDMSIFWQKFLDKYNNK